MAPYRQGIVNEGKTIKGRVNPGTPRFEAVWAMASEKSRAGARRAQEGVVPPPVDKSLAVWAFGEPDSLQSLKGMDFRARRAPPRHLRDTDVKESLVGM